MHEPDWERGETPPSPARKVVVITGGSSGIGLAAALLFAERGWNVGIIARGESALMSARGRITAAGAQAAIATADVADLDALESAAAALERELGPADVWINNAGIGFFGDFVEMLPDEFHRVVDVAFHGQVNGCGVALKRMRLRNDGVIINIGSVLAYRAMPMQSAYSAAKFAVRGFTEALRSELVHEGSQVHVGMVHPPAVNTPFYSHAGSRMEGVPRPPPPVYQPEIIAEAIWVCAAQRRREIRATPVASSVVALNRWMPAAVDRLLGWIGPVVQQTEAQRIVDLYDPALYAPGRRPGSTHGPFNAEAYRSSAAMWGEKNRWGIIAGAILASAVLLHGRAAKARPPAAPPAPKRLAPPTAKRPVERAAAKAREKVGWF